MRRFWVLFLASLVSSQCTETCTSGWLQTPCVCVRACVCACAWESVSLWPVHGLSPAGTGPPPAAPIMNDQLRETGRKSILDVEWWRSHWSAWLQLAWLCSKSFSRSKTRQRKWDKWAAHKSCKCPNWIHVRSAATVIFAFWKLFVYPGHLEGQKVQNEVFLEHFPQMLLLTWSVLCFCLFSQRIQRYFIPQQR